MCIFKRKYIYFKLQNKKNNERWKNNYMSWKCPNDFEKLKWEKKQTNVYFINVAQWYY